MRIDLGNLGRWFMGHLPSGRAPVQLNQVPRQPQTRFRDEFEPRRAAEVPVPIAPGKAPKAYDGHLLAPGGGFNRATSRYDDFPGFLPRDGTKPQGVALFINGVGGRPEDNAYQSQLMADATGAKVIGFYNATEGWVSDMLQTIGDRLGIGRNRAVDSLARTVHERIQRGESTRLLGHSQGAMIISRALEQVRGRLEKGGLSAGQIEAKLSLVSVETFGGAARVYPDGPKYDHYVNGFDPVTLFSGWALGTGVPWVNAGKGARVHKFWDLQFSPSVHSPELYLSHYRRPAPAAQERKRAA